MNRFFLVAVMILALLVPIGAMANQYGLSTGFFGQSTMVNGVPGSSSTVFTIGPDIYSENWLMGLGMSFELSSDAVESSAPLYGNFYMGYMVGHDAAAVRPVFKIGVNSTMVDGHLSAGPMFGCGLSKPIEDATLVTIGPEIYYTFATHEVGYRVVGKFVFKLGASTSLPANEGAGGETPRGMFPAN